MDPHVVCNTDLDQLLDRVDAAVVGGSGGGGNQERNISSLLVLFYKLAEGSYIHPLLAVHRNVHYSLVAKAQEMGALLHGEVGYLGHIHAKLVEVVRQTFLLNIMLQDTVAEPVTGQGNSCLVGLGTARCEYTVCTLVVAVETAQMADNLKLNLGGHRRLIPGVHGLVECRDYDLSCQCLQKGWAVQVCHVVG